MNQVIRTSFEFYFYKILLLWMFKDSAKLASCHMSCLDFIKILGMTVALTVLTVCSNTSKFFKTDVQDEASHNNGHCILGDWNN